MKKILFLAAHRPGRSPGQRFRFEQYLDYLVSQNIQYDISFLLNEKDDAAFYSHGHYFAKFRILLKSILIRWKDLKRCRDYDLIFIYREAVMFGSTFFEKRMFQKGCRIVLDYDDAIWMMDVSEANKKLKWLKRPLKTKEIISYSKAVFVGNNFLASYAETFNSNVKIVPTTIVASSFQRQHKASGTDSVCIGWTGSYTTLKHFKTAIPFLKILLEKYGSKIYIKLISDEPPQQDEIEIRFCKWNKESEVQDLEEIDIGIMPLPDDDWSKGKCGFKGLQYMALEIPCVLSPVGVNTEIITDGENGFLAATEEQWIEKLSLLIESPELREKTGKSGRRTLVEKYSFESWKERYVKYLEEVMS